MEINIGDLNKDKNRDRAEGQGGIIDNSDQVGQSDESGQENFLDNIDRILGQVNSIMDKAQNNPLIRKAIVNKIGARVNGNKSIGGNSPSGNITEKSEKSNDSEGGQLGADQMYKKILQGIKFIEDQMGQEATIGEVKEFLESKPEMVKEGIRAGMND